MNIFKMSKKERKKAIDNLLNNITSDKLLKELIQDGLKTKKNK